MSIHIVDGNWHSIWRDMPTSRHGALIGATMRRVFQLEIVAEKMQEMGENPHVNGENWVLMQLYRKMYETWPERFQVKPTQMLEVEKLRKMHPNFQWPIDDIAWDVALALSSVDADLSIKPLLLLGNPGVGKTHFSLKIAELLGTWTQIAPMSSMTAWWLLSWSSNQWRWSKPGKVFEALIGSDYANPVMIVDEIDKASITWHYDPLGALYQLLEEDTAARFVDEFAEVPIDASHVIWIATANNESSIPTPILDRMNVHTIPDPTREQTAEIIHLLYSDFLQKNVWGKLFQSSLSTNVVEKLMSVWPRHIKKVLQKAFWKASIAKRDHLIPEDIIIENTSRSRPIWF